MIDALISGKVMGTPSQRTSKNGNAFTVAKVRVPTGEDSMFCNVICFAENAQTALLALGDGDAVALAGSLKVGVWQAKDGTHRPSLDMTATQVLTAYHVTKKRRAMQHSEQGDGGASTQPRSGGQRGPHPDDLDGGEPLNF
jgi:single-stranded DNA-binding protein